MKSFSFYCNLALWTVEFSNICNRLKSRRGDLPPLL